MTVALLVALGDLGFAVSVSRTTTMALPGFMPTSGGTRWYDPFATDGVGDGDASVAGTENAQSFGAVDSGVFLDSEFDSLYDVFNETYGKPIKRKKFNRAVPLASQETRPDQQRRATAEKVGREFSLARQLPKRKRPRPLDDTRSSALFYLTGRTPLHLRQEVFDTFDGVAWTHGSQEEGPFLLSVDRLGGKPWMAASPPPDAGVYARAEVHRLQVVSLPGNRIPAPLALVRLHIDQVDRADFFRWSGDGVLCMDRDGIPPLIAITLESAVLSPEKARQLVIEHHDPEVQRFLDLPPTAASSQLKDLAGTWTAGLPRGWPQIEAIVSQLRKECVRDPQAVAPNDCSDVVADFLFRSKRGPDYVFASAACVLLRLSGYPARFVSGFYASPERFDARSRHTPVLPEDVHCWVEVDLGDALKRPNHRAWAAVEPTPGYEMLLPRRTWAERVATGFQSAWDSLTRHFVLAAIVAAFIAVAAFQRRMLVDAAATVAWRVGACGSPRGPVLWTVWLLEAPVAACRSRPARS